ncbi:hypothetical protein BDV93DRAFT_527076 [Ceratobasidium sp. AG-I]|nr:hypothetical protein BDV93DRAFT_527076 [Ceratobasidium sp. AG-I]
MHVLLLGASRNIGYHVTQRLLAKGHTCTLLLRRPDAMQADPEMSSFISQGKIKISAGDALVAADVQRAWDMAKSDGKVDQVFYGIGGEPSFSVTQGYVVTPADLTERGMTVLLSVIESSTTPSTRPRLVTITSNGLDDRSHGLLPLPMRAFYGWGLKVPHEDKINQEKVVKSAAGWDGEGNGWLGAKNLVIVRPAFLTSGECKADKKADKENKKGDKKGDAYKTDQELPNVWIISREDVAHFIAEKVIANWDQWAGEPWVVSY